MSADNHKFETLPAVLQAWTVVKQRSLRSGRSASDLVSLSVAVACGFFVLIVMNPQLLVSDTIPTGGDMGAHVWGPAYLRDELLPNLRLSGWAPDWYAGFPAYQFYMVVPALAIVALNVGFGPWVGVPISILVLAGLLKLRQYTGLKSRYLAAAAVVAAVLLISLPYGVAFKLITVVGLILFPFSVWFMARMARAPEPLPAFLALGSTVFLFDASFWILGGNIMSTLAGEFSFSISLTFAFFSLGLAFRGMDDRKWRARSAVVISLVALCHVIPVFFVVGLLSLAVLLDQKFRLYPVLALTAVFSLLLFLAGPNTAPVLSVLDGSAGFSAEARSTYAALIGVGGALALLISGIFQSAELRRRVWWLSLAGGVGALLAMFWLLPFWYQGDHFNDMGWTRLNEIGPKVLTTPMKVCLPVAVVGGITSLLTRNRVGVLFGASAVVSLAAVANIPQGALWNERLLPFFYLSIYLLTAIALSTWVKALAVWHRRDFNNPSPWVMISGSVVAFALLLVGLSMPLRTLPFGELQDDESYTWGVFTSTEQTKVPGWSRWNYSGYENRSAYAEYHHVVTTMAALGNQIGADGSDGCGRAMWEFNESLDRYGTPMALMLLPYWTDGCIGSMEGLYFESSATTPFHFLNQSALSQEPSRAQRDLPYGDFDIDVGIAQLQTLGVRYYMALTDDSIEAARTHSDLTEVADAQPFVVFEVRDSELVESLEYDPIVIGDAAATKSGPNSEIAAGEALVESNGEESRFATGWVSQAIEHYNNPSFFTALPAEDGPQDWQRREALLGDDGTKRAPVEVSNIEMGQNSISFSVEDINSPVLVKVSHFPNWKASGADGPWRVGPNMMAVIPTSNEVSLSYGRSAVDWLAMLLTGVGMVGVYILWRTGASWRGRFPSLTTRSAARPANPFGPEALTTPSAIDPQGSESSSDSEEWERKVVAATPDGGPGAPSAAEREPEVERGLFDSTADEKPSAEGHPLSSVQDEQIESRDDAPQVSAGTSETKDDEPDFDVPRADFEEAGPEDPSPR